MSAKKKKDSSQPELPIEGAPPAQVLAQAQKDFQDMLNRTES